MALYEGPADLLDEAGEVVAPVTVDLVERQTGRPEQGWGGSLTSEVRLGLGSRGRGFYRLHFPDGSEREIVLVGTFDDLHLPVRVSFLGRNDPPTM
jgi:hypothetical protein